MSQIQTNFVTSAQLDKSLEKFGEKLAKRIVDDITDVFSAYVTLIDERFTNLEKRFDKLEQRFDKLEGRFDKLEKRFAVFEKKADKLQRTLEGGLKRIDDVEQDDKVRDARILRLESKAL